MSTHDETKINAHVHARVNAHAREVLDIEEAVRTIACCLDIASVNMLMEAISVDPSRVVVFHDAPMWTSLLNTLFGARHPPLLPAQELAIAARSWLQVKVLSTSEGLEQEVQDQLCPEMLEFLASTDDRAHFQHTVFVIRGDIEHISDINGVPVDAIAFPTSPYHDKFGPGASGAAYRRAGRELDVHMRTTYGSQRWDVCSVVPTPAFQANVRAMLHCVGPSVYMTDCFTLLMRTYENLMNVVVAEDLHCVAVASISTGALDVPTDQAAIFALRAMQAFVRSRQWQGQVAIVCFEDRVVDSFRAQYDRVLAAFNQVPEPPVNTHEIRGW